MRSGFVILATIVLVSGTAHASQIEDTTNKHYQHDGGFEGDASDVCEDPDPTTTIGSNFTGLLVPIDDPVDYYGLLVPASFPADAEIKVALDPAPMFGPVNPPLPDYDLAVWEPGCDEQAGSSSNPGGLMEAVTFDPDVSGTFVIEVTRGYGISPLTIPLVCHSVCVVLVNGTIGYFVKVCIVGDPGC